jgi:hypothetical protein
MRIGRPLGLPLAVAAALAPAVLDAQPAPAAARPGWMLGLGAQADEQDGSSVLGTLYVGVSESTWLTFAAGASSAPAGPDDIEADTLALGVDQRFDGVGFTFDAEQWGDTDALETQELGGSIYFDRPRWHLSLRYESRDIEIPLTITGPLGGTLRRTLDVGADGFAVTGHVRLAASWRLYFGLAEYDYERNLNALLRIDNLNWLDASTLPLASSLLDHERWLAVERTFGNALLNVRFVTDSSALDGSDLDTLDVAALFPIGRRVDLQVNVGHGRSEFFDAGLYGGLLFLFYGG